MIGGKVFHTTMLRNLRTYVKQTRRLQPNTTNTLWHSRTCACHSTFNASRIHLGTSSLPTEYRSRHCSGAGKTKGSRGSLRAFASEGEADPQYGQPWSIYDNPILYDSAFSFERDFRSEAKFLEEVFKEHSGQSPKAFLEIGCGPGNHATELAKRGHQVLAIDDNETMLDYAARKAAKAGVEVQFLEQDMEEFKLPGETQVDVAFIALNGMHHLHSNYDARDCWECTLAALRPGGLLVVEVIAPDSVFDGSHLDGAVWEAPIIGAKDVLVVMEYGTEDDVFDAEAQVLRRRVGVSVRQGTEINLQGESYVWQRIYTFQELSLLADLTGFEVVATYGALDASIPLGHPEQRSLVVCLAKALEKSEGELDLSEE